MKYIRGLPDKERFERHLDTSGACWLWTGSKNPNGGDYGRFRFRGKGALAHRASYQIYCGEIPDGMQVLHSCDNPPCVNPGHLFVGSQDDNIADMVAKGRQRGTKGIEHHGAKLSPEKAFFIRWHDAIGIRHKEIAETFGVTRPLISAICRNELWRQEVHD